MKLQETTRKTETQKPVTRKMFFSGKYFSTITPATMGMRSLKKAQFSKQNLPFP